ncbi:endonuclease/exonuclease/phosphatase family protein [Nonomuraea guangzhouensis]|uniref:Endonuclease/exonuclease/phosphatase family protein n=1 Tax=Nonomuraea guangzhouensis TaxID=1291555 RepID=A0ABW4GQ09_9ACTN|nr:endonuclease/exonuclease/phosphatase family protein [Nonomuraea guangzhouensis]
MKQNTWVTPALWALLSPFAGWAVLRVTGWEPKFRWSQLVSFTPYAAAGSLVPLAFALAARNRPATLAALVVGGMLASVVLPRAVPRGVPETDGQPLRVMTANVLRSSVPAEALISAVERNRPDVLTVQELSPFLTARLAEAGLGTLLPYHLEQLGTAIYSRFPLRPGIGFDTDQWQHVGGVLTLPDGSEVDVVGVHACAPAAGWLAGCWAQSIQVLPPAMPKAAKRPRVLAGDFNSTLDHAVLRELIATGYQDAASVTGKGLAMTWPYNGRSALVPKVAIDHVLASEGVAVRAFETLALPRTDHRATVTDLVLRRAA